MNALKNVLFFGLLIAVLFGVYVSLNRQPEQPLPAGLSNDVAQPNVQLSDLNQPPGAVNSNGSAGNVGNTASGFPPMPPSNDAATANPGGMAPPYQPPSDRSSAPLSPFAEHDRLANQTLPPPPSADMPPPPDQAATNPPSGRNYPPGVAEPRAARGDVAANNPSTPDARPWQKPDISPPPVTADPPRAIEERLNMTIEQVKQKVKDNKFFEALQILSNIYDNPDLPVTQAQAITMILDQLAAKVIYSRESLLLPDYLVQPGDTLDSIAEHYNVSALLLAKINGIPIPQSLPPGRRLKVLKGPFTAIVSIDHKEMTMRLDGCYAGRFPLALSSDLQHLSGLYTVQQKSNPATAGKPAEEWIELYNPTGKIGIQAAHDVREAASRGRSTIYLSEQDMDDVYGILSVRSSVVIQR